MQEYRPIIKVGLLVVHLHKNAKTVYITESYKGNEHVRHVYPDTDYGLMKFEREQMDLRSAYLRGRVTFQNMVVKNTFLKYMDLA